MASETGYDEALWQTLCEQIGVAALAIPEEYDGAGFSLLRVADRARGGRPLAGAVSAAVARW